jgi:hypothetical protein
MPALDKQGYKMQLHQVAEDLWTYEGSRVSFYGFPFPTRMSVVRLSSNRLWIHSPEKLNDALREELSMLGRVAYLVSPNKLHHLFLDAWLDAYPEAKSYAAPGLVKKRPDLRFDAELSERAEDIWAAEIEQTLFRGSPLMEEAVFFHKASRTLILTDLIENFDPDSLNRWQRVLAHWAGILAPKGKTPLDWRLSFRLRGRVKAREALELMISWQPENILLSHGHCIFGGGVSFLVDSFSWLKGDIY